MTEILKPLRVKIDSLDDQLVKLLVEREKIVHQVAAIKEEHGISVVQLDRIDEVLGRVGGKAKELGGTEEYMRQIYKRIIELAHDLENHIIDQDKA